jgi:hypothetical protein
LHGAHTAQDIHGVYTLQEVYGVYTPEEIHGVYSAEDMLGSLVDDTAQAVSQYDQEIAHALDTTGQFDAFAAQFADDITQAENAAAHHLAACEAQVGQLEGTVAERIHTTRAALDALKGQASEIMTRVEHNVAETATHVQALRTQADDMRLALDEQMHQMQGQAEALLSQTQALESALQADLETSRSRFEALQQHTTDAVTRLAGGTTGLVQQFTAFEGDLGTRVQTMVTAFADLLAEAENGLSHLEQAFGGYLSEALTTVDQTFGNEAPAHLSASSETVTQALHGLTGGAEQVHTVFDDQIGHVLHELHAVIALIEKIKPVLDAAKHYLG